MAFPMIAMFAVATLSSCSDDENEGGTTVTVDLNSVFTGGNPKSVGDIKTITYDEDGRVVKMDTEYSTTITFEYVNVGTRTANNSSMVRMIVKHTDDEYDVLDMSFGKSGYVENVAESSYYYDEVETNLWSFKYNADGQLNYMKRSEGDDEETFITYSDGDITKVKQTTKDENEDDWEVDILYTSPTVTTPIENKGCIMLFDDTFEIDMDEMWYAYYAGLLGKATRHLPMGSCDDGYTGYYNWTFDSNGYPVSIVVDGYKETFEW